MGSRGSDGDREPGEVGAGTLALTPAQQFNGTVTVGSTTVTGLTSVTGLSIGLPVGGTGIPAGATIAGINNNSGIYSITLSAPATASASYFQVALSNTYSGGTTVDQGTLTLNAPAIGGVVIPAGGLTISGTGVVTMVGNQGQSPRAIRSPSTTAAL